MMKQKHYIILKDYVTNSVKKGILKNYVTNRVKKKNIFITTRLLHKSLRKYEKDPLQNIMYWKSFFAPQRFINGRNN